MLAEKIALEKAASDITYIFHQIGSDGRAIVQDDLVLIEIPGGDAVELSLDQAIDFVEALIEKYAKK